MRADKISETTHIIRHYNPTAPQPPKRPEKPL